MRSVEDEAMKRLWPIDACVAVFCVTSAGCVAIGHRVESDVRAGAVQYAVDLKNRGALTGFATNDVGSIILDQPLKVVLHSGIEYPLEVVLRARKTNDKDNAIYAYRLLKESPTAPWELLGARKRINGKTVWCKDLTEGNPQPATGGDAQ